MADVHSHSQRRRNMQAIRGFGTKPEMVVRRLVHSLGFRYRLHRRDLPGTPDLVFPRLRKIIFVHGCFWHMHNCRYGRVKPKTNADFWEKKLSENRNRDRRNIQQLRRDGWRVFTIWECQTRDHKALRERILKFLT